MGRICWVPWLRSAALNNHDADLPSENCLSWQRRQRWEAHLITFGLIINSNYQLLQKSGPKLNFWREVSCKSIIVSIKARFIKNTHKSNKLQIEVEFKNITLLIISYSLSLLSEEELRKKQALRWQKSKGVIKGWTEGVIYARDIKKERVRSKKTKECF